MNAPQFNELTEQQKNEYSFNRQIPFREWYFNEVVVNVNHLYEQNIYNNLQLKAKKRETNYYGQTDKWLYHALVDFPIYNMDVLIIGSLMPWYESIALEHHCKSCTVVEYRDQKNIIPEITYIKPEQLKGKKFDCIFSISSYEHDGLGRYGDPLRPDGDLDSMNTVREFLNENGVMFLAVPVGKDEVVWNAHRVYGKMRLPLLIQNWNLVGKYGITNDIWDTQYTNDCPAQPVFVLTKKK